ncbi:hypothetical protein B0T20DRAFT_246415 [Sordaria brevicollis]|uniref:Uncharacterized protein n=1 Tax=Sordaria brevicollis TaxID=83679 RepID=A0AAE0PBS5_SORBR|nr:hypothetical protein B0T20DRAFT_246415 [Sordaria brevicollis]
MGFRPISFSYPIFHFFGPLSLFFDPFSVSMPLVELSSHFSQAPLQTLHNLKMWMVDVLRVGGRAEVAARDSSLLPARCYDDCTNAESEARMVGKVPSVCNDDRFFYEEYQRCTACIKYASDDPEAVENSYLISTFGELIAYCSAVAIKSFDPSWYSLTTSWGVVTSMENNTPVTATVMVTTSVLRAEWTGGLRQPASLSVSGITTASSATTATGTENSPLQTDSTTATAITVSFPFTTTDITRPTSGQLTAVRPEPGTNGPAPWVWAIIGAVIALVLIGLGIVAFLYRRGKIPFFRKTKPGLASAQEPDGEANWRTGDKPELHGESSALAITSGPPKELDPSTTVQPKELDSSEKPAEMPTTDDPSVRPVELPTEFNETREPPKQPNPLDAEDGQEARTSVAAVEEG